ncbi:hypothetical protein OH809_26785 [Streptomyces sp. NBC_00873]|uniref:hypothetical protein n=1 Tax=unclassified Streptomyces TaxID=2593676 RepID=UPI00386CEE4B|nr:hypothetical protein OH809_26785 [Streptomyces sp. NBC_00873]WTA44087.1 hypothetical protein OH821_16890 [Streptomyces sp. NBC_00842]
MENWPEGARSGHAHEWNDVTVQRDGLGRQLSELSAEPGAPEGSDGPVFVDESGRRSKTFRRLGWVLAAVCACYAVTLAVALIGGNSTAPWLPLSGQKQHKKADEVQTPPTPSGSADTVVPVGAAPGATAVDPAADVRAKPSGSAGSGSPSASAPGKAPSKPAVGVTPTGDTAGGGTKPAPSTSAPESPAATTTPPVDPGPTQTTAPPTESPDPPVQEQEAPTR